MAEHVYLAGPITGLTFDEGQDWRIDAKEVFASFNIDARSPLRSKEYLKDVGALASQYHNMHPLSSASGIVCRDRNDCVTAGVVLANLHGATRVSIGTVMEVAWADAARVPVILVAEEGNVHLHGMMTEVAGYVVSDLETAYDIALTVLGVDLDGRALSAADVHGAP